MTKYVIFPLKGQYVVRKWYISPLLQYQASKVFKSRLEALEYLAKMKKYED